MSPLTPRVRIIGDPVLRQKSIPVSFPEDRSAVLDLLLKMFRILEAKEGLGLAAPQAGVPLRVFIAAPDYLEDLMGHTVFINPVLDAYGPEEIREEGCLSIPGIWENVRRPSGVRITATDQNGQQFSLDLGGLAARLVQHENDHLDGVLFTDKLSPMKKRMLRGKLRKLREEND